MKRSDFICRVRSMLIERRDSLVQSLRNELISEWNSVPSKDVRDFGDAASESEFRELTVELANADARDLRQIEEALTRVDEGTYGFCAKCQKRIPIVRLRVLPYATRCIRCQRNYDSNESFACSGPDAATDDVEMCDESIAFRQAVREDSFGITVYQPPSSDVEVPAFIDAAEPLTAA